MRTFKYIQLDIPHRLRRYIIRELKKEKNAKRIYGQTEYIFKAFKKNWRHPNWRRFCGNQSCPAYKKGVRKLYINGYGDLYLRPDHCVTPVKGNTMTKENIVKLITINQF